MIRISIWTAIFLVVLRLAIGWHFFFEGYHKIHSVYVGQTDTNRPFTSEGYFREAEGPLGEPMRGFLGDPDAEALARLKAPEPPKDEDPAKVNVDTLMPPALDKEWTDYFNRFVNYYKLDEGLRGRAERKFKESKEEVVRWLRDGKKTVKKKNPAGSPAGDAEVTVSTLQRIAEYETKLRTIRDIYTRKLPAFGQDVEGSRLRALKQETAALRTDLLKDLDSYTARMKDGLAEQIRDRTSGFNPKLWDATDIDSSLLKLLEPKEEGMLVGEEDKGMPPELGEQWDRYVAFAKQFSPSLEDKQKEDIDRKLARAKRAYVRWLTGKDEYSGQPDPNGNMPERLKEYRAAADAYRRLHKEWASASWLFPRAQSTELKEAARVVAYLRAAFQGEIQRHTDTMKSQVGSGLGADLAKGYAPAEEKKGWFGEKKMNRQQLLDWLTRWGLTVTGAMLLVGLLTRLACLAAVAFLVMTFLMHPAYPWLPTAPMNEGYYVFVNKNIVELAALLALATTASGKWLGLDALLSRLWGRRRG